MINDSVCGIVGRQFIRVSVADPEFPVRWRAELKGWIPE